MGLSDSCRKSIPIRFPINCKRCLYHWVVGINLWECILLFILLILLSSRLSFYSNVIDMRIAIYCTSLNFLKVFPKILVIFLIKRIYYTTRFVSLDFTCITMIATKFFSSLVYITMLVFASQIPAAEVCNCLFDSNLHGSFNLMLQNFNHLTNWPSWFCFTFNTSNHRYYGPL